MSGLQIARDRIDRYRSFGAFGKPAYQSHVQLRAMLLGKRGERLANYFARPTLDAEAGELRWTAEVPGAARGWHEMAADEQAGHALELELLRSGLLAFAQDLRAQGSSGGAAAFASLLEQAMKVPAQGNFLYFVGDQPVIAFWGFENHNGASVDPSVPAPAVPAVTPEVAAVADPVDAAVPPLQRRRVRWWWLLGLLLALALLALLLRTCAAPPVTALQIPPGALERGDLSFLAGDWGFGPDRFKEYFDSPTNIVGDFKPLLRLDAQGGGSYRWTERIRHGRPTPDCVAPVRARTDGKKLYLNIGPCVTPGVGRPMASSALECTRDAAGQTRCDAVNDDGHRWNSPLYRMQ